MQVASTMFKTELHVLFLTLFYFGVKTYHADNLNRLEPPKKYVIDLDLPEEQRWNEVVTDHSEIVGSFNDIIRKVFPKALVPLVERLGEDVEKYIHAPYSRELKGLSTALNMSVGDVVIINILYDITAFCTSIVSQDSKGQIWHSRNLDYGFTDILKNLTIFVDFQKEGKTVYSAVTFAGYVGVMTGQRPNAFTVTVDERDQGSQLWNLLVGLLDNKAVPVSFLVRDVLQKSVNYSEAVQTLAHTDTAAPAYFIIGGVKPEDAAVITKGRLKVDDIWRIDTHLNRWFEVETNYDHWKKAGDNRRFTAISAMKSLGQNSISVSSLLKVMSSHPVLNRNTVYTTVMSAAKPEQMQTWMREMPPES